MSSKSDGGTDNTEKFYDPNQSYPHPSSLQSPRGTAVQREHDFTENNDVVVQYVQRVNRELRNRQNLAKFSKTQRSLLARFRS